MTNDVRKTEVKKGWLAATGEVTKRFFDLGGFEALAGIGLMGAYIQQQNPRFLIWSLAAFAASGFWMFVHRDQLPKLPSKIKRDPPNPKHGPL